MCSPIHSILIMVNACTRRTGRNFGRSLVHPDCARCVRIHPDQKTPLHVLVVAPRTAFSPPQSYLLLAQPHVTSFSSPWLPLDLAMATPFFSPWLPPRPRHGYPFSSPWLPPPHGYPLDLAMATPSPWLHHRAHRLLQLETPMLLRHGHRRNKVATSDQ